MLKPASEPARRQLTQKV